MGFGLLKKTAFITEAEEQAFVEAIDAEAFYGKGEDLQGFNGQLRRRFQMYGKLFCFQDRTVKQDLPIPDEMVNIMNKMKTCGATCDDFNSIMVNEYSSDQGIMPHVDAPVFGEVIVILSLLSDVVMRFEHGDTVIDEHLPRRSLIVMQDESRTHYKHSISKAYKVLTADGQEVARGDRRLSVTLRKTLACNEMPG